MSLLSNCTSGGCGAKIGPHELKSILGDLPFTTDNNLLVGFDSSDDAAVYELTPGHSLVSTVDFFPPMVDDPFLFGEIAAANALSDVYAMGGKPLYALNLVCFPEKMDKEVLHDILLGGAEKAKEAGALLVGGHSIYDSEPKYGLAVTGQVDTEKLLLNNTPRLGDLLILTKPLGVGLVLSAMRVGEAQPDMIRAAELSMARLNGYAAEKMAGVPVSACTDVTGFGLLVHATEMAGDSRTITIDTASLPMLPGAYQFAADYYSTAAGQRNRNFMEGRVNLTDIPQPIQELLFDPQTSGGLLISVPANAAAALCDAIQEDDPGAAIIGQVNLRGPDQPPVMLV